MPTKSLRHRFLRAVNGIPDQQRDKGTLWPAHCIWPEPTDADALGSVWEAEDAEGMELDEEGRELLDVKEYYDDLVSCGRLNEDYSLNEDYADEYQDGSESEDECYDEWQPEKGEEFWDGSFDLAGWEDALLEHLNLIKIEPSDEDPSSAIQRIIGYEFINENLLRQAFTRRAFAVEYHLKGDNEQLEFLGDTVLQTVVTKEIIDRYMEVNLLSTGAPFLKKSDYLDEGLFTKIRAHYIEKEYLASRAAELDLEKYILYGTGEEHTDGSLEDMMEALLGAVAVDCNWNWTVLGDVVDHLLLLQLDYPDRFLKKSYYEIFNSWHQRHFGRLPEYCVYEGRLRIKPDQRTHYCTIRFFVPKNDKEIARNQRIDVDADGRSKARELAAKLAYNFVVQKGLWINLKDAHVVPCLEDSINQLQELYQKKYLEEPAAYTFEEKNRDQWECNCVCRGIHGLGRAGSKTAAKKKAAYMALVLLLDSAGCCEEEWKSEMWRLYRP